MSLFHCQAILPEWKRFLRASEESTEHHLLSLDTCDLVSGEEAQRSYQDIIAQQYSVTERVAPETRHKSCPKTPVQRTTSIPSLNTVMRKIESHDTVGVAEAIKSNASLISAVDPYGWSLLMCATCTGSEIIVKLLLDAGAKTEIRDKKGDTCVSLAQKKGHLNIVRLLINSRCSVVDYVAVSNVVLKQTTSMSSCEKCHVNLMLSEMPKHLTSTVHLLNSYPTSNRTFFSIPESNRGYQLMLKSGWNQNSGLGPNEDGRKLPLKTVLKKDRRGVGASKPAPRITHFSAFDSKAVSVSSHPTQKKNVRRPHKQQQEKDIQREKWRERNIRRELS